MNTKLAPPLSKLNKKPNKPPHLHTLCCKRASLSSTTEGQENISDNTATPESNSSPSRNYKILKPLLKLHGFDLLEQIGKGFQGEIWKVRELEKSAVTRDKPSSCFEIVIGQLSPEKQAVSPFGEGGFFKFSSQSELFMNKEKLFAAKVMSTLNTEYECVLTLRKEYEILKELSHPNLIEAIDFLHFEEEEQEILIMEYFEGLSLEEFIKFQITKMSAEDFKKIISQILAVVGYLHEKNICHRDISTKNILISPSTLLIKLIDLGLAHSSDNMLSPVGLPYYRAPEMLKLKPYTEKVDVWMVGLVAMAMLTSSNFWNTEKVLHAISKEKFWISIEVPSTAIKKLLEKMLEVCPSKRASIEELLLTSDEI